MASIVAYQTLIDSVSGNQRHAELASGVSVRIGSPNQLGPPLWHHLTFQICRLMSHSPLGSRCNSQDFVTLNDRSALPS